MCAVISMEVKEHKGNASQVEYATYIAVYKYLRLKINLQEI